MKLIFIKLFLFSLLGLLIMIIVLNVASDMKEFAVDDAFGTTIDDVLYHQTDDYEIAYRIYGDEANPAIVLVHGFLGSSYDYRYLSTLLEDDYYVIAIDLIGFGHSDKPLNYEYVPTNQSNAIKILVDALDIDSYTLVGHSMGGLVAMFHAYEHLHKVDHLVLVSPPSFSTEFREGRSIFFYRHIFNNYYIQRFGFRSVHYNDNFNSSEYFDPMYYFTSTIPSEVLRKMAFDTEDEPLYEYIPEITIPTLIVYGEADTWTPLSIGEDYHQRFDDSTFQILDDTGHMPMIESVNPLYDTIVTFLD